MGLLRNAARCLQCGDVIESIEIDAYVSCSCRNISIKGGLPFIRIEGPAFDDASYEPLHIYQTGETVVGRQFFILLDGLTSWDCGDGRALDRLFAALLNGPLPLPPSSDGMRRLGYLAEIALTMSPKPEPERKLLEFVAEIRERLRSKPPSWWSMRQRWLPRRIAGPDDKAAEWGLRSGLSEEFRKELKTRLT